MLAGDFFGLLRRRQALVPLAPRRAEPIYRGERPARLQEKICDRQTEDLGVRSFPRRRDRGRRLCGFHRPRPHLPQVDDVQTADAQRQTGGIWNRRSVGRRRRLPLHRAGERRPDGARSASPSRRRTFRWPAGNMRRSNFSAKARKATSCSRERRSLFFKKMQIVRGCDAKRNILVYMTYSDKLVDGSPKNSTSTVPDPALGQSDRYPQVRRFHQMTDQSPHLMT